jgi:hypothetical protein
MCFLRGSNKILKKESIFLLAEHQSLYFIKSSVFWDITPCSPLQVYRRFEETCRLHIRGRRMSHSRNQHETGDKQSNRLAEIPDYVGNGRKIERASVYTFLFGRNGYNSLPL